MTTHSYPRMVRAGNIEVPRPRNGRPSYAWVQGWAIEYSPTRVSMPMRLNEARALLREAKGAL